MILGTMSNIAVEPSTYGQYGGKSQNWDFSPPIEFQWNPLHLVHGFWSMAIQYNSVNEEDMWKGIVNWFNFKGKLLNYAFTPIIGLCIHRISTF